MSGAQNVAGGDVVSTRDYGFGVALFAGVALAYGIGLVLYSTLLDIDNWFAVSSRTAPLLIAVGIGLVTGIKFPKAEQSAAIASGVGAFLGYVAYMLILTVFGELVDEFSLFTDDLAPYVGYGIGLALTSAIVAVVVGRFLSD